MESQSEKEKLSTSVVVDVSCSENDVRTSSESNLHQVWFKIMRVAVIAAIVAACAFTIYSFITLLLHGGESGTVPYEPTTNLDETTTTYLNHSTPNHPRLPSAVFESIRRQNQALLALGCQPTPRKVKVVALLSPKDRILDEDFDPKEILIGKCDDKYSYCGVGSVCVPARNDTGQKAVTLWYRKGEGIVTETRIFESDSYCECQ